MNCNVVDGSRFRVRRHQWIAAALRSNLAAVAVLAALTVGCHKTAAPEPAKALPLPEVAVVSPVVREYTELEEFTGRLEPSEVVEIRARVGGYLDQILFKEGAEVEKGDLLAVIDPRTYEAELARATASAQQAQSRVDRVSRQLERGQQLIKNKVITQEQYEQWEFDQAEAEAALRTAEATAKLAQLNLDFTKIHAPVKGKIGRRLVDEGNLVKVDDTLLATIGSFDPIRAYFEIDERTVLRLRQMILAGDMALPTEQKLEIQISLADENEFALRGVIDFTDNTLDPRTGTLRARATIDNHELLLLPGLIVRCRMPIGKPRDGLFIPEEALGSDQGQRFLYVLNGKDEVVYRRVSVGQQLAGWRFVEGELGTGDRVIVSGLQRVRPGQKVDPKLDTQHATKLPPQSKTKQAESAHPTTTKRDQAG